MSIAQQGSNLPLRFFPSPEIGRENRNGTYKENGKNCPNKNHGNWDYLREGSFNIVSCNFGIF